MRYLDYELFTNSRPLRNYVLIIAQFQKVQVHAINTYIENVVAIVGEDNQD